METYIRKIALTGGPAGGKSTLQRAISDQIPGAYCMPEAATILLSGGYPAPNEKHHWSKEWQRGFQVAVAAAQIGIEDMAYGRAFQEDKSLVVFDRGLPDAAAYLPGGMRELEHITGRSEESMLSPYTAVLHLPSSALLGTYDKTSNPHRFEEAEAAKALELRTIEAWQNHQNRIIVGGATLEEKVSNGLAIVQEYL